MWRMMTGTITMVSHVYTGNTNTIIMVTTVVVNLHLLT